MFVSAPIAPASSSRLSLPGATSLRTSGLRTRPASAPRPHRWFVAATGGSDESQESPAPGPANGPTPPPGSSPQPAGAETALQFEKEIAKELVNWCNYKAVRTVLGQLEETDPVRFRAMHLWVADHQSGLKEPETFNMEMLRWNREMALRVFATRDLIHDELKFWKVLEVFQERVGSMKNEVFTDLLERSLSLSFDESQRPTSPAEANSKKKGSSDSSDEKK